MEGTSIGRYRIVRMLGEGGMGTVWLGEHDLLGRNAAIKVLLPEYTTNATIVQRFFNEARAVSSIADPGIVQVYDFGNADGRAFIVMELLDGEGMDVRLRRIGRFTTMDAIRLMAQIATSLGAAHAKNIIHRDLKPENIFIVGDPAVTGGERTKILDFGIAKLAGDDRANLKTRTGVVLGTPVYMSPEQCRGSGSVDARSDIYSLGCVLFTMLCGRPPFQAEGSGDLIIAHVTEPPPVPSSLVPGLRPEVDALVARCLEKHPHRRFQSTQELVEGMAAVEAALHGMPAVAITSRNTPIPARHDAPTRHETPLPLASKPTTLGEATGSFSPAIARRRTMRVVVAVLAASALGGIAFGVLGAGDKPAVPPASKGAVAPPPSPESLDAATPLMASTPDAAPPIAEQTIPPPPPVASPAPPPDAAPVATQIVDAGVKPAKIIKRVPKPGGSNATTGTVDRGD